MNDTLTPNVGDKVIAGDIPMFAEYSGKVCTVTSVVTTGPRPLIQGEFQSIQKPDDSISLAFYDWTALNPKVTPGTRITALKVHAVPSAVGRIATVVNESNASDVYCSFDAYTHDGIDYEATEWFVHEWSIVSDDTPAEEAPAAYTQADIDHMQRTIDALIIERDRNVSIADARQRELNTGHEAHADLGRRLLEQAESRGWCSEFDEFISDYNADCAQGWEIAERRKPRVQVTRRVKAEVYKDVQVWVDEGDEYTTDTDEMYEEQDSEYPVGDEWPSDVVNAEMENIGGFDEIDVRTI